MEKFEVQKEGFRVRRAFIIDDELTIGECPLCQEVSVTQHKAASVSVFSC